MAYALRAYFEQENNFGTTDRIEIHEDGFGGTAIELGGQGRTSFHFEHQFIGSGSSGLANIHDNPIIMGSLTFNPWIDNSTKKTLISDIADSDPFDFQVQFKRGGSVKWYGYPSGRIINTPERPQYGAEVNFKDFEILKYIDFPLEDNRQHIITTIADLLSYTQTSESIYTATSWQEEDQSSLSDDFLNQIYHDTIGLRDYGDSGDENDTPITVYEAIKRVAEPVLLFMQWDGFRVNQLSAYTDPTSVLFSEYDDSGTQQSSSSVDRTQTGYTSETSGTPSVKVTSNNTSYPSIKQAKVFYNKRIATYGIQVPSIVSLEESTAETGTISASTGSTVVTGSGTSFLSDVSEGDTLWVPQSGELRELGEVASVTDNTSITLTAQANYTVSGAEWHIDAEETGRYSQDFVSDGTQRIRLATTVRVTGNFGTTQIYGRYRIQSGSYWYNKTTDGWTDSGEVINEFRARGTTSEVSGSIALETSDIPDAADGDLILTLFIAEDQNDSSANVDVTTYEDTTFAIRENTASGNAEGTIYELQQSGGFERYDFGEDLYGDGVGGAVYLPSNYRYGTSDTEVTENWRRRGETPYQGFHELKLREVLDFQRTRTPILTADVWGEIEPEKVLRYDSEDYFYIGGSYNGRWQPIYILINESTASDTLTTRIKTASEGGSASNSSTVGSGGLTESEADGLYFRQNELLSEVSAGDLPTLYGNIGLDDGSADLDLGSLDINGATFVDSSRNVSAVDITASSDIFVGGWRLRADGTFFPTTDLGGQVGGETNRISILYAEELLPNTIRQPQTLGDKYSFFGDRIGMASMYGFGIESSTYYFKSNDNYRWYSGTNADGGTSAIMTLASGGALTLTDTLTINSQLLFTLGNEQLLSTDANVQFNEVDIGGNWKLDSESEGGIERLRIQALGVDDGAELFIQSKGSADLARITLTPDPSPSNYSFVTFESNGSHQIINSSSEGTESTLPLSIRMDGTEALGIDTSRNLTTHANLADDGFSAGFQGSNWQITDAGQAEFEDVFIRGGLTAYEAIINRLRYNFGNTVLSAGGGKVASVSGSAGSETVVFEDPEGNTILPVAEGDLLLLQSWDLNRTTIIKRIWRKVASISGTDVTLTKDGDMPSDTGSIVAGDELVVNGNDGTTANRDAIIFQSVTETTHPFIKIQDNINSFTDWGSDSTTQVLIGDLTDAPDLSNGTTPSGIGFFAKGSAYLEGEIVASSGQIATFSITDDLLTDGKTHIGNDLSSLGDYDDQGLIFIGNFGDGSDPRIKINGTGGFSSNGIQMRPTTNDSQTMFLVRSNGNDVFTVTSAEATLFGFTADDTDLWTGSSSKSSATVRLGSTEGLVFDVGGGASETDQRTLKWLDSGSLRGGMFVSAGGRTQIVGYDGSNPVVGVQIDDQVELSLPVKMVDGEAYMLNLPTSDPSSPGQLWNDSGTLKVSTTSPPSAPSAPSNPSLCKNTTLNVLRFEWDSVASADSYDVYRSTDGSNFSFITNTSITRYDDSVPFNNQSQLYYYKVQARNDGGNSGFSSTVNDSWNTATAC